MFRGRLYGLISKEFAQMLRDPVVLFLIFFLTTAELVMCTLALGMDVKDLKLGVIDRDRSVASRALIRELTSSESFVLQDQLTSLQAGERQMRKGALHALVEVPPNFGARLAAGRPASIGVAVDGSNADIASRARAYIVEMTASYARGQVMKAMPTPGGVTPAVRVWYNPDLTNTRFMALGMLAQAGFMLAVILPAAGLVREKQNGTLEQIRVTPIRAHELFIGKVTPPVVICLGSLFPSLLVARLLGVTMSGSLLNLLWLDLVFLLSAVSIGVFVATVTSTLQQAMLASFFGLFPLLFLSGSVTPIESMPVWLQVATEVSPLRHFIESVNGLFLKGAGLGELWPHALALIGVSAPMFGASWLLFRRQW
jgi:ABC-2 type transport system permease protein